MNLCQEVILEGGQADPPGSLGIVSPTKDWRLGKLVVRKAMPASCTAVSPKNCSRRE